MINAAFKSSSEVHAYELGGLNWSNGFGQEKWTRLGLEVNYEFLCGVQLDDITNGR